MAMGDILAIKHKVARGDDIITYETLSDVVTSFRVPYDGSKLTLDVCGLSNGLYVLMADVVINCRETGYRVISRQDRELYYLLISDGRCLVTRLTPTVMISDGIYTTQALMIEDGTKLMLRATHLPVNLIVASVPSVNSFALQPWKSKIHDLIIYAGR